MKRLIIPISALFASVFYHGQSTSPSTGENYIYSRVMLDYDLNNQASKVSESVEYLDGLGRSKQVVRVKASPGGKDLVSGITYDGFGRAVDSWLPVPMSTLNGGIQSGVNSAGTVFYGDSRPFGHKELESSPLDRMISQIQPGQNWQGHPVEFGYDTNNGGEVYKFTTTTGFSNGVSSSVVKASLDSDHSLSGFYKANKLYKNTVTDEDGNKMVEFKNSQGQVVMVSRFISATESADTYYVYNEYNLLSFVIPPKAVGLLKTSGFSPGAVIPDTVLNELCYQYRYDSRRRVAEKKLPGKGWEYMVYDRQDRLVMSQDANMGAMGQWLFTKYDQYGRVAYTGLYTSPQAYGSAARAFEQGNVNSKGSNNVTRSTMSGFTHSGMDVYYDNSTVNSYPSSITKLLSISYYDTYALYSSFNPPFPGSVLGQDVLPDTPGTDGLSTKGLPVMSLVKNIEDDNWTKNYTWYDKKGRGISAYSINHLEGRTWTESKLDFAGMVKQSITRHKRLNTDTDRVITENFTYDHQNRLLTHTHQVDNNPVEYLVQNTYNELSQLQSKKVGGLSPSAPLQQVDYLYNIRGWMTKINDPKNLGGKLFGYEIKYNSVEGEQTPDPFDSALKVLPRYNGNIAEVDWRTSTVSGDHLRRYGYVYDKLNRLSAGFYQKDSNPSAREYYEKVSYDLDGNIMTLKRSAEAQGTSAFNIDELTYVYENSNKSNRLLSVTDSSTDYRGYPDTSGNTISYDNNGNMLSHNDKGLISIDYNFLNLPSYITYRQGLSTRQGIIRNNTSYLYRSDGVKVRKIYRFAPYNPLGTATELSTEQTDYLDSFQYKTGLFKSPGPKGGSGNMKTTLEFYPTAEGYFDFVKNKYIYNYADHLGNVRLSYFHNGSSIEVLEENNYYPFGLKHEGYNPTAGNPSYQYKYNGKELQTESGMYDYGARFYMPDIGRWGVVDPLAEKSRRFSPYNYAVNNPVLFIDPDGREIRIGDNAYYYQKDRDYSKYNEFESNAYQALDKLYSSEAMNITIGEGDAAKTVNVLDNLINDPENILNIVEKQTNEKGNGFDPYTSTIGFDPSQGLSFTKDVTKPDSEMNTGYNSPTSRLGHELLHGYNMFNDDEYISRRSDKSTMDTKNSIYKVSGENVSFTNQEEKYTTGLSNQISAKLGEDKRTNYGGKNYKVENVTSIKKKK